MLGLLFCNMKITILSLLTEDNDIQAFKTLRDTYITLPWITLQNKKNKKKLTLNVISVPEVQNDEKSQSIRFPKNFVIFCYIKYLILIR